MVKPAPDNGPDHNPASSSPAREVELQRCVFGKLVTEQGGPVAEGTEHTITSRTLDLPDEIAIVCRPDQILPVDVNPLRLVEPALKDIGGLLIMPLACPARSNPILNWVLVSRLRAYPERGPDKGGRPATMMTTLAVERPLWSEFAARMAASVCGSLVAVPDEIAAARTSRFDARCDRRSLPAVPHRTLGEMADASWVMLDGLRKGEPTHWSRKTFPLGEGDFLSAVAAVYDLLPPEYRHLPMVSSGIAFGVEKFDITYVKDREPQPCEFRPAARPAFVDIAARLDSLHVAKKKPKFAPFSSYDDGAQQSPPTISLGHWGDSRRLLKGAAQRANDLVNRPPSGRDLARTGTPALRESERDNAPRAGQDPQAGRSGGMHGSTAGRAGAEATVSSELKPLLDHCRVLRDRMRARTSSAPQMLNLFMALDAFRKPMDDAQFEQDWPKIQLLLQPECSLVEIEVLEALRALCKLDPQLVVDAHAAADGEIGLLARLLDLLFTIKTDLSTHSDKYVGDLIQRAKQELIQALQGSGCLTAQELEHAFDPARPTGGYLLQQVTAGDTMLLSVLQQSLWMAGFGWQPDRSQAWKRICDTYATARVSFDRQQAEPVLLNVIRRYQWATPLFTKEQVNALVSASSKQKDDFTTIVETLAAAARQRKHDQCPASETFLQLIAIIQKTVADPR